MEHPLIPSLAELSMEDLQTKISELNKKLSIAMRSGNGHLCNQIRMALESYKGAYQQKINEQYKDSGKDFGKMIDIS